MMRPIAIVLLIWSGCGRETHQVGLYTCSAEAPCHAGANCEATGFCSFPDPSCPSQRRYGSFSDEHFGGTCVELATCNDGLKNGDESDVDCGGSVCAPCREARGCSMHEECESRVCSGMKCAAATCSDGAQNGQETDVDCGGELCPAKCDEKRSCLASVDCKSGLCKMNQCVPPACLDQLKNGPESDIDCGGSCPPCFDNLTCSQGSDCQSGVCSDKKRCLAPSCTDLVKNGQESDIDCGASCVNRCPNGKSCGGAGDCAMGICDSGHHCVAATCLDKVRNGSETGVDCGGGQCSLCSAGQGCLAKTDCQSGVCYAKVCLAPSCFDGVTNGGETDLDCGGSCAQKCTDSKGCGAHSDCGSGVCGNGKCQVPTCSDGVRNGTETGTDCGGSCSAKCIAFGSLTLYDTRSANDIQAQTASNQPVALAVGDLNLDGKPDVVTANQIDNNITLFIGKGDGTFTAPGQVFTATQQGYADWVAIADLNSDGKPDLATTGWGDPGGDYLLGNGNGTFQGLKFVEYAMGYQENQTISFAGLVGDFNQDGRPDFMVANGDALANTLVVFLNQGSGTFAKGIASPALTGPCSDTLGDFNRDGILDLAVTSIELGQVGIHLGKGNGTFKAPLAVSVAAAPCGIATGDLNQDGKLDLAVTNPGTTTASVLLGKGDGTFQNATTVAVGGTPVYRQPLLVDLDRDGGLDLVTALQVSTKIAVLHGNHDGTFGKLVLISATACAPCSGLAATDLNGDGKLDLALSCRDTPAMGVLLNTSL